MNFSAWLQNELNKRNWSQTDLVRHARQAGYKLARSQITHILNDDRLPTGEVCIAIAHGLSLPREDVFRARGWLLHENPNGTKKQISPEAANLAVQIDELAEESRQVALEVAKATISTLQNLARNKSLS